MDEYLKLLTFQQQLEKDLDGAKKFVDMSVTDTIRTCIATGLHKKAERLRSDFKVPDKRFAPRTSGVDLILILGM